MTDPYRPGYHFTTARNWINDPNGLVWFEGEWHLFYQYNPEGNDWGHMSWGHAVSTDLIDWVELPVAIPEDPRHMIFSGSAVVDWKNSSGLGDGQSPPLIALYTGAEMFEGGLQSQCVAYSHDKGRHWTKFAGNPVLDIGLADFRDPKVLWHAPTQRWIMVVAHSTENRAAFYTSPNLINWTHQSFVGPCGAAGHLWECPDLFPLEVESEPGVVRWAFKIDLIRCDDRMGSATMVLVGDFDGVSFTPCCDDFGVPLWQWVDGGRDYYAAISWSDVPREDGRRIWIGWLSNHQYGKETPTSLWRGAMSIPRALSLRRQGDRYILVQRPVVEVERLRGEAVPWPQGEAMLASASCDLEASLGCLDDARFELSLSSECGAAIILRFDVEQEKLCIDRSKSGEFSVNGDYSVPLFAPFSPVDGRVNLRLLVDHCMIELFLDDGTQVTTIQHFLPEGRVRLALSGQAHIESSILYPMSGPLRR
jgi:fructan beta-fructosidase